MDDDDIWWIVLGGLAVVFGGGWVLKNLDRAGELWAWIVNQGVELNILTSNNTLIGFGTPSGAGLDFARALIVVGILALLLWWAASGVSKKRRASLEEDK